MEELFDIRQFDSYKEDNRGEVKKAKGGLFEDEYNIVRHFPEYFLDYREMLDPTIRWTDRL